LDAGHRLSGKQLGRKGSGVLVDSKLTMSQQCVMLQRQPTVYWAALGTALPAS